MYGDPPELHIQYPYETPLFRVAQCLFLFRHSVTPLLNVLRSTPFLTRCIVTLPHKGISSRSTFARLAVRDRLYIPKLLDLFVP